MNFNVSRKFIAGYIIIILIPTFSLELALYNTNYKSVIQNHLQNEQFSLNIAKENFETQLTQIESLSNFFETSTTLKTYLQGEYTTTSDAIYYYIKDIKSIFETALSNPLTSNIIIYGFHNYPMDLRNRLTTMQNFPDDSSNIQRIQLSMKGLWEFTSSEAQAPTLSYYKSINSIRYPYYLGILEIDLKISNIFSSLNSISDNSIYIYDESSQLLMDYKDGLLIVSSLSRNELFQKYKHLQYTSFDLINCELIQVIFLKDIVNYQGITLIIGLTIILFILSLLYFTITKSITLRLTTFNQYILNSDADHLVMFHANIYQDEVGILIQSHNQMIEKINLLIHENYHYQLQRKDAEYYALQAQIKPHFLYNILENIRMSAETNQDSDTANMLLALGKYMRYTLNPSTQEIPLEEELQFAKNYLDIHKIRMNEQLTVEIASCTEIDDVKCPRFIMQPLLENSLKHGFEYGSTLQIVIHIREDESHDNSVVVEIQDSGIGISEEHLNDIIDHMNSDCFPLDRSVGLRNVHSRLISCFGANYGGLVISSSQGLGTTIAFCLPRQH